MIKETNFLFENQTGFYRGKVRDVYYFGDRLVLVASDRISAFDVVLKQTIPYKGQVLNQTAAFFLKMAQKQGVSTWFEDSPHPYVSFGRSCVPLGVEIVVRGYLAGHAWREYSLGKRLICGVTFPDGLKENDKLPYPVITPTTKAHQGHDEDISKEEIITQKLVHPDVYEQIEQMALKLFQIGSEHSKKQNLILVDTKYEFGFYGAELMVIDEIHTPDSSRYFYLDSYEELQQQGLPQRQLSKEFVRKWLIDNGFQGKSGQIPPNLGDSFTQEVSQRYIELYEKITGLKFEPVMPDLEDIKSKIISIII